MNKKLILWISALVVTFLITFLHQRLNPYYPVSGSFGIEGERITYVLDKLHRGKEPVKLMIRTDLNGIKGNLLWRKADETDWSRTPLVDEGNFLSASIPALSSGEYVEYRGELQYKSKLYLVPPDRKITMIFSGKRPASVMNVFYFFLFGGLLLTIRGAFEYFNPNDKRVLFASVITMFFFVAAIIFYPFIKTYDLDAINKTIPGVSSLFDIPLILIFLLSFITAVTVFIFKKTIILLISGILIIIIYQFSNFY